jgi:hypothetical protein
LTRIAIYFPADMMVEPRYRGLDFAKATMWDDMIDDLYKKVTVDTINEEIEGGDVTSLQAFVREAAKLNPALVRDIRQMIAFRLHTEGGLPAATVHQAEALLNTLNLH